MGIELVVFDWSGTVSDDIRVVYEADMKLMEHFGRDALSFDGWLATTSSSAAEFMKTQGIDEGPGVIDRLYKYHLGRLVSNGMPPTAYPEAMEVFQHIFSKGKKIVILSTHPQDHLEREARDYGLAGFISRIIGDSEDKSVHLSNLCREFGVKPENTLFVGDTIFDLQAAKKVGVKSVAILGGYHSKELLMSQEPDHLISKLTELKDMV